MNLYATTYLTYELFHTNLITKKVIKLAILYTNFWVLALKINLKYAKNSIISVFFGIIFIQNV